VLGRSYQCQISGRSGQAHEPLEHGPCCSNLFIYGIEGKHYKFVDEANGIIDYADGVDATNIKYPVTMGWNIGNQFISYIWNGNAPDYWQKMDEFNKSAIISKAMGFTFDASQVSTEYAACASVVDQYNNALMCGALDPLQLAGSLTHRT